MTDTTGGTPPFPGFPGFPPAEMLDKMWDMMRMTPFGAAFPGMQPGTAQGFASPLTAMSEMMSPLMNVEELDKRITDMRAVEQWLKLNLNMLQSAIQALEVQRATLATLRAFGAYAQDAMAQPAEGASQAGARASGASPWSAAASGAEASAERAKGASASADAQSPGAQASTEAAAGEGGSGFDPSAWWNLLQSQFNQLAAFAMTQPGAGANAGDEATASAGAKKKTTGAAARGAKRAAGGASTASAKPAAKRAPARKSGATPAAGSGGGGGRSEK